MAYCSTRSQTEHAIFGQPSKFSENQLPTCEDVLKLYWFYRKEENYLTSVHDVAAAVGKEVKIMYEKAGIPTMKLPSIIQKVKRVIEKMQELNKYSEMKKQSQSFEDKVKSFCTLFDVCTCRCFEVGVRDRGNCNCPLSQKIPALEWEFWVDQKTCRKMIIGSLDKVETSKLLKKQKRVMKKNVSDDNQILCSSNIENFSDTELSHVPDMDEDNDNDTVEDTTELLSEKSSSDEEIVSQNRNKYPELCKAVERCKLSNRDACIIANALLKDMKLLTPQTVIDPAKIQRQRQYWREQETVKHAVDNTNLKCIGFDGKQDTTVIQESNRRISVKQEHYVVVSFPGNVYIDHAVPQTSKAADVAQEIFSIIKQTKSDKTLQGVLCDGTNNNTGKSNGIIRKLEQQLSRPLQWLICLLHTNELPFRRYFSTVDECKTTGPSTSSGLISNELNFDPKDKPIVKFIPIAGKVADVAEEVSNDLSTDQLYFLRACLTVQVGRCNSRYIKFLELSSPGNISHARWLTKANRILRLYMSKLIASEGLQKIVRFIVNVYGPTWFHIKKHKSSQDGAKNFFFLLQQCHLLSEDDQDIIFPVLQNNSYFAHPESILIAAVADDDADIRKQATQRIINARHSEKEGVIRVFDKNNITINFSADSYITMIDWSACIVTAPPLLSHLSDETLATGEPVILSEIPCHSQAVERAVKDVSAASLKVCGHEARHGMVLMTKKARMELPKVTTKADFH